MQNRIECQLRVPTHQLGICIYEPLHQPVIEVEEDEILDAAFAPHAAEAAAIGVDQAEAVCSVLVTAEKYVAFVVVVVDACER